MVIPSELSKSTLYEVPKQVLTKKLRKDFLSSRHFVRVLISKISCETSQNLQRNKDISRRCLTCQPFWTQFLAKNNFRARLRRCHHVFTFNSDYKKHINPAWDSLTCQFLFTCAFERHGHSILKWQPKQQNKYFVFEYRLCSPPIYKRSTLFFIMEAKRMLLSLNPQTLVSNLIGLIPQTEAAALTPPGYGT